MKHATRAPEEPATLMDHIHELRNRLFAVAALFIAASIELITVEKGNFLFQYSQNKKFETRGKSISS